MAAELEQRYGGKIRVKALAPGLFLTDSNHTLLLNPGGSYNGSVHKFVTGGTMLVDGDLDTYSMALKLYFYILQST